MSQVVKPPWLPEGLYQSWLTAYAEAGGSGVTNAANTATEVVRNSPEYDSYFPGLRREDGSLRYEYNPEATYFNNIESFRNVVGGMNMNPDVFADEYIELIEGDVSPQEFTQRANTLYDRVIGQSASIRQFYGEQYGIEMSDEGILASLMSNRVEQAVLDKQITMAEIGGEAAQRNFDITTEFVEQLATEGGMNRSEAAAMFGTAEALLPTLNALARRHGDPDDDFDITEFASAASDISDPEQLSRLDRLISQEQSKFTGNIETGFARNRGGGTTGLASL